MYETETTIQARKFCYRSAFPGTGSKLHHRQTGMGPGLF